MNNFDGIEKVIGSEGYISYSTMGATIGTIIPGIGTLIGAGIGAIADVAFGFGQRKKAKRKMKKAFIAALIKRYHNTIFVSALERMGEATLYLLQLGLKPGTPDYDIALIKKLKSDIGYEGGCSVTLYGPPPDRPLIAQIDKDGKVIRSSGYVDPNLPTKWKEACQQLHHEALRTWADMQVSEIQFQRELQTEREEAAKFMLTKIMINSGILIVLGAYSIRYRRKLDRELKDG